MFIEENKLKVIEARKLEKDNEGNDIYLTRFSNGKYFVLLREDEKEDVALIMREDNKYPQIHSAGIQVSLEGVIQPEELDQHLEKINAANETYKQALTLAKDVIIK